ncbi:MAG: imidazolonepropionase-like amidohydrolase [Candidatus Pelagisphaera sp.]|jgi:imidazolonepropionase-like amidohydrolase
MRITPLLLVASGILICASLNARDTSIPVEGLHTANPRVHALVGATVVVSPDKIIEHATVILRDGLIESVGQSTTIPDDARVWDFSGKTIYPGFIDAYTHYGMPGGLKPFKRRDVPDGAPAPKPQPLPTQTGASYWNPLITPERDAANFFKANPKDAAKLSDIGFSTVATFPGRGIFRGQGALVNLNGKAINQASVDLKIAQHIAFELARRVDDGKSHYPTSLMGSIALIRQAFYDAQWQAKKKQAYRAHADKLERPVENAALAELQPLIENKQFALFQAWDELDYRRIEEIADEFSIDFAILGNGYEYRRSDILKDTGATVILPLAFPKTPHVERVDASLDLSLEQLQHWEFAPSNAAYLAKQGIPICLTSHFLSNPEKDFWKGLRATVKRGLSKEEALAAITTRPAELYGMGARIGTLESGKIANLVVATGDLFENDKAKITAMWIDGDYLEKKPARAVDLKGTWTFDWDRIEGFESGAIEKAGDKWSLKVDESKIALSINENEILLVLDGEQLGEEKDSGLTRLHGRIKDDTLSGTGQLANGTSFAWSAKRNTDESSPAESPTEKASDKPKKEEAIPELAFTRYPAGAFGVSAQENPDTILIKNATVWTSADDGVLETTDLLVKRGKISKIGRNIKAPKGAVVIDATGKHLTPGLIDCHSHTAMSRGVNEAGSAITVEVRASDIINPVNINVYRQLAGGLTISNLLHGSANPMGGQSQVIKHRWGESAEAFVFKGARPGVKFALGENVKQSNWGDKYTTRYPQTRMGVEQFMKSAFRAAEDYERKWSDYEAGRTLAPPRKNLRLEAALEILRGKRDVHIHSYRQDEILMFARLAKTLDLKVAAFQHILEGYKVADAMVEINAGGSTFSDWWAYKFEVLDAIPYNGVMMHNAGVLTSFNSDDAELATRLNTEAAKAVKYGGLSEEEALKFVTLNPAIQLGIDDRVGSLETGKDADFVIWNDHPLSTYASAEQTWIDGIKRFDKTDHLELLNSDNQERESLIQKALAIRLKELKLGSSKKEPDPGPPADEHVHGIDEDHDWEWIYHDGSFHYSCSALEEEAH